MNKIPRAEIYFTLKAKPEIPTIVVDRVVRNIEEDIQKELDALQESIQKLLDLELALWEIDNEDRVINGVLEVCRLTHCQMNRRLRNDR